MPRERFSALHLEPGDPVQDSGRARHRVGALFREAVFNHQAERLAIYLSRELGVPIPGDGRYSAHWQQFIRECHARDFLYTVTLVYRYLFWHVEERAANWWRDVVREIFVEEHLAYEIDDVGGVHPVVDQEFQETELPQSPRFNRIAIKTSAICLKVRQPTSAPTLRITSSHGEQCFQRWKGSSGSCSHLSD